MEGDRLERAIQHELTGLESDHRLLIILRDIEGLSYREIANILGVAEGTVKSRIHRARHALRAQLTLHLKDSKETGPGSSPSSPKLNRSPNSTGGTIS